MHTLKEVSKAKHRILEKYFPAWARILGQYHRLIYVDCFAGAGKYDNDEPGSPLIILDLAEKLVSTTKIKGITLIFIEKNKKKADELQHNLDSAYNGDDRIRFSVYHEDAKGFVELLFSEIPKSAPAFYFIDPYGHPISIPTIRSMLGKRKEVFLNLMWHGINRNLENRVTLESITEMFGHERWKNESFISMHGEEREKSFLDYVISEIGAEFALPFKIRFGPDDNIRGNRTKYYLIHFSNHPRAMLIMKDIMYGFGDEKGTFNYSASKQGLLFSTTPQTDELREHLKQLYVGTGKRISFLKLQIETYKLMFTKKQYIEAIKQMEGREVKIERTNPNKTSIAEKDIIIFK
ncbi:MAG: three-Cys-motif partner protein TcmP [Candidatus Dadabacteria bacterium]